MRGADPSAHGHRISGGCTRHLRQTPRRAWKPCAGDRGVADAIVTAVQKIDPKLAILAISGTQSEQAARAVGVPFFSEIFADRGYLSSGQLVPREQYGAMIHNDAKAAQRLIHFLDTGLMSVIDGDPIALSA